MKTEKPKTRGPTEKELRTALSKIAQMGEGIEDSAIDWERLGRCAKQIAVEVFKERCVECGK